MRASFLGRLAVSIGTAVLLTGAPFTARYLLWYAGIASTLRLSLWDVDIYRNLGSSFLTSFSSGNFTSPPIIGNPPFGLAIIGLILPITERLAQPPNDVLLIPMVFSSLTCYIVYQVGKHFSRRVALLSWALTSFDPYSVQFSVAFLDSITNFFLSLALYLDIKSSISSIRNVVLLSLLLTAAVLSKFTGYVFVILLCIMYALAQKEVVRPSLLLALSLTFSIALNPQNWTPEGIRTWIVTAERMSEPGTPTFNTLRIPLLFGPLDIGLPVAYPWYFLTYLGVGYVHRGVLPYVSHLLLFITLILSSLRGSPSINRKLMIYATTSVLTIALLPRNYWTYSWSEGFITGTLSKQFYPYYFVITVPPTALVVSYLLFGEKKKEGCSLTRGETVVLTPVVAFALLAPIPFTLLSLNMPYWDFVFTLIWNYSRDRHFVEGFYAFIATLLMVVYLSCVTFYMIRRLRSY